jgi:1-acyl-sn-glycerol-3-phosphate acyltransferase
MTEQPVRRTRQASADGTRATGTRAAKAGATKTGATKASANGHGNAPVATTPASANGGGAAVRKRATPPASANGAGAPARKRAPATVRARPTPPTPAAELNGHAPATVDTPPAPPASTVESGPDVWEERVADSLAFLRRRITGQYDVDELGFDAELTDTVLIPLLRLLYRHYFRVEVLGAENLPRVGSALVVANHSGTLPADAIMLGVAVHDETPARRHLRLLAADLAMRVPVLSELARKSGATMACNPDAERLLRGGELVGVFPEGYKGLGKNYRDRYKLQRFGRGGFVSAALRTGAPIVPVSIVGAEEIYPMLTSVAPVAKVLGLPYLPITPLFPWLGPLGALPLPSKWLIEFGTPIQTAGHEEDADDPIVVFNLADQVREIIQSTLHALLERRPDPFG